MRWKVRMWLMSIFGKRISPKKSREGFRAAPRSQWRVSNPSHGYHRAIVAEDA